MSKAYTEERPGRAADQAKKRVCLLYFTRRTRAPPSNSSLPNRFPRCSAAPAPLPSVQPGRSGRGRGGPPVCSKRGALWAPLGPASPKVASHWPIVWGSRSSASPTRASDQPRLTSQRACHRSRSRGVGARRVPSGCRSRSPRSSNSQRVSRVPISFISGSRSPSILSSAYHTATAGFAVALL
jgi:hypothetical protein